MQLYLLTFNIHLLTMSEKTVDQIAEEVIMRIHKGLEILKNSTMSSEDLLTFAKYVEAESLNWEGAILDFIAETSSDYEIEQIIENL